MKVSLPSGGLVGFGQSAVEVLHRHRQVDAVSHEAGGMLLGRLIDGSDDIVVDEATEPTGADRRGRYFFNRARAAAQRYIDIVWGRSKGTSVYLGEWHSHPEDDPSPSGQDEVNWRRITRKARYDQDFLIFVIVGRRLIRIWRCDKSSLNIIQLQETTQCEDAS